MRNSPKRLLLFTNKLGYQTRSFEEAAKKLNVEIVYVTDRCHQLEDPWGDRAIAVHFESPQTAAATVVEAMRGRGHRRNIGTGRRPVVAAAYAARELGIPYNHPASVEACRSKLRLREIFRDAGLPTPWFRTLNLDPLPEPALLEHFLSLRAEAAVAFGQPRSDPRKQSGRICRSGAAHSQASGIAGDSGHA